MRWTPGLLPPSSSVFSVGNCADRVDKALEFTSFGVCSDMIIARAVVVRVAERRQEYQRLSSGHTRNMIKKVVRVSKTLSEEEAPRAGRRGWVGYGLVSFCLDTESVTPKFHDDQVKKKDVGI